MISNFKNQFILNDEILDELLHNIKAKQNEFAEVINMNATSNEHRLTLQNERVK